MIVIKIKLSTKKNVTLKLLTSWDEATFDTFVKLSDASKITNDQERIREFVRILATDGASLVDLMTYDELIAFDGLIAWINNLDSIIPATFENVASINIHEEPWEKLIVCHQAIEKNKDNLTLAAPQIIKAYVPDFDFDCSFSVLYSAFLVITEKVFQFHEKFKTLADNQYKPEEIKAGVREFSQFGFFGTLNALCKGDVTLYDDMLKQKAGVVYNTLVLDKFKYEYQLRLQEIQKK